MGGGVGGRTFRKLSHLGGTKFFARKGRHKPEKKGVGRGVGEVATFLINLQLITFTACVGKVRFPFGSF